MEQRSAVGAAPAIEELLAHPPILHGSVTHGLTDAALRWIAALPAPLRTLETGCGLSTVVFAARGDEHTCITYAQSEEDAVRGYCEKQGIDLGTVTFVIERSEVALPRLADDPLDMVLIDGSHAFPHVFVDWMYSAPRLEVGGSLVIDDVHLWTGKVLREFLASEPEWELLDEWGGRTTAFRKRSETPFRDWYEQPFVLRRSTPLATRLRMSRSLLRQGDIATLRRLAGQVLRRD